MPIAQPDEIEPVHTANAEDIEEIPKSQGSTLSSKAFSAVMGLGKGATAGFGPAMAGGVGAVIDSIMEDKSRPFIERYREARDYAEKVNQQAQADNPKSFLGGELGGGLASSVIAGPESIAGNMALGGAFGLGNSKADLTKGEYSQAFHDTAKGVALGGLAAGVSNVAIPALVESSVPISNRLANVATGRAAQALGGKFSNKELGRKGLDLGVVKPLSSTEKMLSEAEQMLKSGNAKMDEAISSADALGSKFNPKKVALEMESELGPQYRSPLNRDVVNQYENTLEALKVRSPSGENIPLREGQNLKSELDAVGFPRGKRPLQATQKQEMAQDASRMVRNEITNVAEGSLGQSGRDLLNQGRIEHGFGAEASPLLKAKLDREQSANSFRTLASGVGNLSFGGAGYALTHGPIGLLGGLAAKKGIEFASKPQVQAFVGDVLSKTLQKTPEVFGKFSPQLQQAAQRGPAALSATSFILSQQPDGEFREISRKINGQEEP